MVSACFVALADCPSEMIQYRFHCYQFATQPANYEAARRECKQNGGDLASFWSHDDVQFVAAYLTTSGLVDGAVYWIGLNDLYWKGIHNSNYTIKNSRALPARTRFINSDGTKGWVGLSRVVRIPCSGIVRDDLNGTCDWTPTQKSLRTEYQFIAVIMAKNINNHENNKNNSNRQN